MAEQLTLITIQPQSMTLQRVPEPSLQLPSVSPVALQLNVLTPYLPIITGNPTISGTIEIGQVLTPTAAPVDAYPSSTRVFRWQRSDTGSAPWTTIQDSDNYTIASADENKYLRVVQRETNTLGTTVSASAATSQVPSAFTGILDTYTGAVAAYSLRLLRKTYTGYAINVRRDSDNATQDIGFVDNVLDTTALEEFCNSTDGFVTNWYDQSGNGNDAKTATASRQPKIVNAGSVILENEKVAIDFDGVNDSLALTSSLNIGGSPSIIGVLNTAAADVVWRGGGSDYWYFQASQIFRYRNGDFDASFLNTDGLPVITGVQKLIATYKNSNSVQLSVNGSDIATKTSGTGTDGIFNYIGSDLLNMDGVWQELIIWNRDQTNNRNGIQTNINDFYSIY